MLRPSPALLEPSPGLPEQGACLPGATTPVSEIPSTAASGVSAGSMTPFADLLICLRFFSRLPVPETGRERALGAGGLAAAAAMAPLAGLVLASGPALVLAAAIALRLPADAAALLALSTSVVTTGALHEDALADCADGFGGGRTRERKLAIMRDSRIGAFGATAIALSLLLRAAALAGATIAGRGVPALLVAATLSRAACLVPLALLPPARTDGAGAAVSGVDRTRTLTACALALGLAVAVSAATATGIARAVGAAVAAAGAALAVTMLARRQIGGQTGDVAGAAQQIAEIAALLVYAAAAT